MKKGFLLLVLIFFSNAVIGQSFTLSSKSPTPVSNSVALNSDITLNFSASTESSTIIADNIIITGKNTGIIAGSFSGGGTATVVFNPTTDFKAGEVITVTLTTSVQNASNAALSNPQTYIFTTKSSLTSFEPSFTTSDIYSSADNIRSVFSADLDGDGDMDIISGSENDDKIAWHENDGNANPSFASTTIATSADGVYSIYVTDIDSDGDMDIVSASIKDNTIAWYENDGNATPGFTARDITTSASGATNVSAADMDNDGDMDIISVSHNDNKISWYENDGAANPDFIKHDINEAVNGFLYSIFAADMDGDGDMDMVTASANNDRIDWYENDGAPDPNFTITNVATSADGARCIFVADMDNDGDMDIISASKSDNTIAWYENDGAANPDFTAINIYTSALIAFSVYAADMDNDGDMDIVSGSTGDAKIIWHENDGEANPGFTTVDINSYIDEHANTIFVADVDGDGDLDIISGSGDDDSIAWHENSPDNFVSTWAVSSGSFELPLKEYAEITIDWGDGTSTAHTDGNFPTHTYSSDGTKTITVAVNDASTKDIGKMYMNGDHASRTLIRTITNWGEGKWETFDAAFRGATNLTIPATDEPDLSLVTNMREAFSNCTSLVGTTLNDWNVSTVTNMSYMFYGASVFNGNITSWNTTAVTTMQGMFAAAAVFDQDINTTGNSWNTAAVINMQAMFYMATAFNGSISSWNTAAVTNMNDMFKQASAFNQNIGSWNTAAVTNMRGLFWLAVAFNQDISSWNTAAVINMEHMFRSATIFNQNINTSGNSWNTAAVTNMGSMFRNASAFIGTIASWNTASVTNMSFMFYAGESGASVFNGNITSWNTAAVTDMSYMFAAASVFDQNINTSGNSWNTAAVTNMQAMFYMATAFNGNITSWNTAAVTIMQDMFKQASMFNQNISQWNTAALKSTLNMFNNASAFNQPLIHIENSWNLGNVTNMTNMFNSATSFSRNNYDIFLYSQANNPATNSNITITVSSKYSDATSRAYLTETKNWDITDLGQVPTIGIASNISGVTDGFTTSAAAITLTFTTGLSTSNFEESDITVSNGTLSSFVGSGTTYTVIFTPTEQGVCTIDVAAGTFTDSSNNNNNIAASQFNWTFDSVAPTVNNVTSTKPDGSYTIDEVIPITVTFSEVVNVTETPTLTLETGGSDAVVNYSYGTGSTTLTFNYTVAAGHNSSDLDYVDTIALVLNSGTIKDAATNNATLTLASPGAANSLGANKALVIDTTAPLINLAGNDTETIEVGATYTDQGATATDNYDTTLTVVVGGDTVDTAIVGAYTVTYNVSDSNGNEAAQVTRTVSVVDTTAPVIALTGDPTVTTEVGTTYTDQGATATDNYDTTLTVVVGGDTVDTAIVGTYTVTYNVSDSNGNEAAEVTRTVTVKETLGLDSTEINSVSIYPNPTTSKWTVESSRVINTVTLFNLLGQKVLEQTVNDTKVNIDASNLKTGVYMLKVNKTTLKRVIKR